MSQILLILFCFELVLDCYAGQNIADKFSKYETAQKADFKTIENNIYKKWHDMATSSNKVFVNYYQQNNMRLIVDYEKGIVVLEGIKTNINDLKEVLSEVITENESSDAIINLSDIVQEKLKTKKKFIDELMGKFFVDQDLQNNQKMNIQKINFNFLSDHIKRRAKRFRPSVANWSKRAEVDFALVMAMIRQESAFNPRAQSSIPAYGLMQIVPKYAGRDFMISIVGKDEIPSKEILFDPDKNIMFGTGYIKLLKNKFSYFTDDKEKIQDLIIASYNWGPQRILDGLKNKKLDLKLPNLAEQINKIAPLETRNYLQKVKSFKTEFQNME
jgi:membrane-bound lytic murein transglycosylase C